MSPDQDNVGEVGAAARARGLGAPGRGWLEVLGLVALCVVMFVVGLGDRGLAYSEGHRVGPGWEMLDAGMAVESADAWLVPRLFGAPYLRKPPGMSWAIAATSGLLGTTEFAARLPSALAMVALVLVSWRVTTRWLGSPWGFAAGLAQAMFPFFWSSARSAEIEMVHAAGAGCAALLIADVMMRGHGRRWPSAIGAGIAICVMALAKGPAGVPVVLAAAIGVCVARRSVGPLARTALAWVLMVPGVVLGATAYAVFNALDRTPGPVISQDVGEFLWDGSRLWRILTLPAAAWGSMLPASLALLVVAWKRREGTGLDAADVARCLGFAWLAAIVMYTVVGVSNPRYLLPAGALLPPVVAAVMAVMRRGVGRVLMLGSAWTWPIVLAGCFVGFLVWYEGPRGRTSGDAVGAGLGAALGMTASEGGTVWADQLVECRPEVLLYARHWAPLLRVRWIKPLETAEVRAGDVVIVRVDGHGAGEGDRTEKERCAGLLEGAVLIHEFPVHKYAFEVYRVGAASIGEGDSRASDEAGAEGEPPVSAPVTAPNSDPSADERSPGRAPG